MNELRRMAYLDAMGVDAYVSRGQLAGAALTRRLVIVPARTATAPAAQSRIPAAGGTAAAVDPVPQVAARIPRIENVEQAPAAPKVAAAAPHKNARRPIRIIRSQCCVPSAESAQTPLTDHTRLVIALSR